VQPPPESFFNVADFVRGLQAQFDRRPLNPKKVILAAIPVKNPHEHGALVPAGMERRSIQ